MDIEIGASEENVGVLADDKTDSACRPTFRALRRIEDPLNDAIYLMTALNALIDSGDYFPNSDAGIAATKLFYDFAFFDKRGSRRVGGRHRSCPQQLWRVASRTAVRGGLSHANLAAATKPGRVTTALGSSKRPASRGPSHAAHVAAHTIKIASKFAFRFEIREIEYSTPAKAHKWRNPWLAA